MALPSETCSWILEPTDEPAFQRDAVERSREILVVVDFWATWCQPCRMLGPTLEKLAKEYDGKFLLVKADTDKLPNIASGFGVQSIPAVYAVRDGQLLDYFVGLLPEQQIREWVDRLLPTEAEQLVAQARQIESSDLKQAEEKYSQAVELDPNLASARIGLAALLLSTGRTDESRAILEELEKRGFLEPEAEKLKAQLNVMSHGQTAGELDHLRASASASPADLPAKIALAEALAAQAQYEAALETALAVIQSGKKEFVEPARKLMVDIFHVLGDESELTNTYRRRLSSALY